MDSSLRRVSHWRWSAGPWGVLIWLALLAWVPLLWTAFEAGRQVIQPVGWQALVQAPQTRPALILTLWTGLASCAITWWASSWLLAHGFIRQKLSRWLRGLPVMLATPHAALAIGLVFLLAPSGWLLRALSPWLTGFELPPPWPTTQDRWGLGLILALCAKEIPFMLWIAATQLQRDDLRRRWLAEQSLAQTFGYSPRQAFWRVVWPQLSPKLFWPALAVLAYSLTVVEMALVIGPTTPPTLAVLAWQWLLDVDPVTERKGAAAGALLAFLVVAFGAMGLSVTHLKKRHWRPTNGPRPAAQQPASDSTAAHRYSPRDVLATSLLWLLHSVYIGVLLALAVGSIAGLWPFPEVWPTHWTWAAWQSVWLSSATAWTTLSLAITSATLALLWSVAWLEWAPRAWEKKFRPLLYLSMLMPGVLWVVGLHAVSLQIGLEGQWLGVLWAHLLMVLPYVLLALSSAYQGFDPRYAQLSASLGHGRWHFLWCIKWPLLKRSLTSAFAVGFAVSVAQYLPTLYVGAGRIATVTTEAVTLASGAQRSLTSAYAWLQWSLPVLVFGLAAWLGQPRRFRLPKTDKS
jgi:putative thiamine transport system permease protein